MGYLWIIIVILTSISAGFLSYKTNISNDIRYPIMLWILNIIPLWVIIAKYSKNILLDGIIYDIILIIAYTATVMYLTHKTMPLNTIQLSCVVIIILSLIIFKLSA